MLMCCFTAPTALAFQVNEDRVTEAPVDDWQPPDLADLPLDWWVGIDADPPANSQKHKDLFFDSIRDRVSGLDAENQIVGRARLENLRNLAELLRLARQGASEPQFEPIPTKDEYLLSDILDLHDRIRLLEKDRVLTTLEIEQTERKTELLLERRDSLLRAYQSSKRESPERILVGLERVSARFESETEKLQADRLHENLGLIEQQIDLLEEQQVFAQDQLVSTDASIADLQSELAAARARRVAATENLAGLQKQLLDVVSAPSVNASLQLLRTQQLTRASVDASLARIEVALLQSRLNWYLMRVGQLNSDFDYRDSMSKSRQLTEDALKQLDVWYSASQATLVSKPPGQSRNAQANFQMAQSVAHETLVLIEKIRDLSGDLLLVEEILSTGLIATQSGLNKVWSKLGLATGGFWERLENILNANLFSIGDAPVTPGGLIKMILILVLAWGISWFTRQLLQRLGQRKQFAKSPAIYTLGRLAHYIIITIGIFASFASIGIDFSNFALIAGALSVGIGFGLQAIVNNFVSGLILLFEGSLRVGDHIALDSGLAGVVREINTRATVVTTTDGIDVVVPNSELVTTKLTNWTLRESVARVRIGFGVAYGSDKERVKEAALLAAKEMDFILLKMPGREPQVRLVNFGDSSLDFELLAWVSRQGVRRPHRVRASFLWALETRLGEAGIEIPFPQRDLHIKSDLTGEREAPSSSAGS